MHDSGAGAQAQVGGSPRRPSAKKDKHVMYDVHVREPASLAGRAQFLFLAIKPARFYLRELHDVLRVKKLVGWVLQ